MIYKNFYSGIDTLHWSNPDYIYIIFKIPKANAYRVSKRRIQRWRDLQNF